MNRTQTFLALLFSVLAGVVAVGYATLSLQAANATPTRPILTATQDIPPGVKLTPALVAPVDWPATTPLNGAVDSPEGVYGRVTAAPMVAGEPILPHRLAPEGSRSGLSGQISHGKRAFTIKVNEVVGVAGFAMPGTYVDVLVTLHDLPGAQQVEGPRSRIVLERLLVLAAAQEHTVTDEHRPKIVGAVTLEVRPDEAERLDLARSVGTLSLALRNPADLEAAPTEGARLGDVLAGAAQAEPAATASSAPPPPKIRAVRPPPSVEVYRGVQRSSLRLL
jgi:pilus assembly protein CpaB